MKYIIDTANLNEIKEALSLGVYGVTANPSMYLKEQIKFYDFLREVNSLNPNFLSAEAMGSSLEEMLSNVDSILSINPNIIIKINFSSLGLKLVNILSKKKIKTAVTLIFNITQATLAINAGADYIFPFIGRNDAIGISGLKTLNDICTIIKENNYSTKVVAASIKNVYHLQEAALAGAHYVAVNHSTLKQALFHELTVQGEKKFIEDWKNLCSIK